jgi:hypothetical protein
MSTAHLPGPSAPQASRAIDALRHLEPQHQLDQLVRILDQAAGPSLPHLHRRHRQG